MLEEYLKELQKQRDDLKRDIYVFAGINPGYITLIFDYRSYELRIISLTDEMWDKRDGKDTTNYRKIKANRSFLFNIYFRARIENIQKLGRSRFIRYDEREITL